MKNSHEVEDLSFLDNLSYIDLFSAGDSGIGFIDANGVVQTDSAVANVLRTFGDVKYIYLSEDNEIFILAFENEDAIRIYKQETVEKFFTLLRKYPDLDEKYHLQIARINRRQEKKAIRATTKKVKRENEHTRNVARIGLAAVTTLVIGTSAISYISKNRDKANTEDRPSISDNSYELPETETTDVTTETSYLSDLTYSSETVPFEEGTTTYTTPSYIPEEVEDNGIILNYEDRRHDPKATLCKENYYEILSKYATMYGIDPKLMLAIATQERGTHSDQIDEGGAIGLMQLQVSIWQAETDAVLSAYNYSTESVDTYNLPLEDMELLENNIRYSCMIFQNCMRYMHNNPIAAIQCYNFGTSHMQEVFSAYYASTGITMEEALADVNNTSWLEYRSVANAGDPEYLEHVVSYLGTDVDFLMKDSNKETIQFTIRGRQKTKALS